MTKAIQVGTLVFLRRDDEILLAMKKRGFGKGKWNGPGGKPDPGESIEETAIRETEEEIGITPLNLHKVAHNVFRYPHGQPDVVDGHVFICTEWQGEPVETEEMAPRWFNLDDIPYDQMWDDDKYWLPQVLDGKNVECDFTFDGADRVIQHSVRVIR